MTTSNAVAAALDCNALFTDEGLPAIALPGDLSRLLEARGRVTFATPNWSADIPLREAAVRWLREGSTERMAWCAVVGHGVHSSTVQVGFVSPRCGIFINKLVSQALNDAAINRRRMDGTFRLMRRLIDTVEKAPFWPADRRLALVDDDTDTLCWGWPHDQGALWIDLSIDRAAWIAALTSVFSMTASMHR